MATTPHNTIDSSLSECVSLGDVHGMRQLLANPKQLRAEDIARALIASCTIRSNKPLEVLIEHKIDVNATDRSGELALRVASVRGDAQKVQILLRAGANPNAMFESGTVFYWASGQPYADVVQLLIDHGADVHAANTEGRQPIHSAAGLHSPGVLEAILSAGADPNQIGPHGETPLEVSIRLSCHQNVPVLLDAGAKVPDAVLTDGFWDKHREGLLALLGDEALEDSIAMERTVRATLLARDLDSAMGDAPQEQVGRSSSGPSPL